MDLLNIHSGKTASKPSLLSSLWSIQVQHQNEASTMIDDDVPNDELRQRGAGGSQQSLPGVDIQMTYMYNGGGGGPLRLAKSLSDLSSTQMPQGIHCINSHPMCADPSNPCPCLHQSGDDSTMAAVAMDERHGLVMPLSRQQKNSNICQWLQKLKLGSGNGQWDSTASSPTSFMPQSQSCFLRTGTPATMDSTNSMDFMPGGGGGGGGGREKEGTGFFQFGN